MSCCSIYQSAISPLLFRLDPESAHHLVLGLAGPLNLSALSALVRKRYLVSDARLSQEIFGTTFANPVGLAAGFDKDCRALGLWRALGFSHVELGTVTWRPQPGNPRPRIFRYRSDAALINRMGFPSLGAEHVRAAIPAVGSALREGLVLGLNIGKNKDTPIENAAQDYAELVRYFQGQADYFTVNVSSPNTPELRKLQERPRLKALLEQVQAANTGKVPLLVKIAPDLSLSEVDDVIACATECNLSGIIATNTTFSRQGLSSATEEVGGLSGAPLRGRALEVVRHLYSQLRGRMPIVGVGGVSSAADAWNMLAAGASLVQVYTGLIYKGPGLVRQINRGLLELMSQRGIGRVAAITGCAEYLPSI